LVGDAGVVRVVRGGRGEAGGDGGRKSGRYVDPSVSKPRTGNAPGSDGAHDPPASHNARRIGPKQSLLHRPALPLPLPERSSPRCSRNTSAYSRRPLVSAQWLCVSRENNGTALHTLGRMDAGRRALWPPAIQHMECHRDSRLPRRAHGSEATERTLASIVVLSLCSRCRGDRKT
jgi:hypothetical protein